MSTELELHIWPGAFDLSSIDPTCLAAVLYLQLVIPNSYSLVECTSPDSSPNGQLPYVSHDLSNISSLGSIMKYVSGLPGASVLDSSLSALEKAQTTAWCSHAASHLGDLVAYSFYSSFANYSKVTHPALVQVLPIPQRYYVPNRIRESYHPRLESAGLWDCVGPEQEESSEKSTFGIKPKEKKEDPKESYKKAFARAQIVDKARTCLETYSKLLGDRQFFFNEKPSTLDTVVASHILLLLNAPFPDPLISNLLNESFPTLVKHARLVLFRAFPFPSASPRVCKADSSPSWRSLIPQPRFGSARESTPIEKQFAYRRWAWFGLAIVSTAAYWWMNPLFKFVTVETLEEVAVVEEEPEEDEEAEEESEE